MGDLHEWYTLAKGETKQWRKGPFLETRYRFFITREFPESSFGLDRILLLESIVEEAIGRMMADSASKGHSSICQTFSILPSRLEGSTVQLFAEEPEMGRVLFSSKRMAMERFDASDFLQRLAARLQSNGGPSFDNMAFLLSVYQKPSG